MIFCRVRPDVVNLVVNEILEHKSVLIDYLKPRVVPCTIDSNCVKELRIGLATAANEELADLIKIDISEKDLEVIDSRARPEVL